MLLRIIGALADFVVESFLWTCFILSLPLICVAFFVYEIFWNTKAFMFYLLLVPSLLIDMWYDIPAGREPYMQALLSCAGTAKITGLRSWLNGTPECSELSA